MSSSIDRLLYLATVISSDGPSAADTFGIASTKLLANSFASSGLFRGLFTSLSTLLLSKLFYIEMEKQSGKELPRKFALEIYRISDASMMMMMVGDDLIDYYNNYYCQNSHKSTKRSTYLTIIIFKQYRWNLRADKIRFVFV